MKKVAAISALLLVTAVVFGQSTFGTGQWLHDGWLASQKTEPSDQQISDVAHGWEYTGFVLGAANVMSAAQWIDIPVNAALGQWLAVVGKYLDNHPGEWNLPAEVLVYRALHAVWPGKKIPGK